MTHQGRIGGLIATVLVALAVVVPRFTPDPNAMGDLAGGTLLPPSSTHLLGTDQYSRDVLARLAQGAAISLQVAVVAVLIALIIGTLMGVSAGSSRRAVAVTLERTINIALSLPRIVVLLVLLAAIGTLPTLTFAVVIGATGWPPIARLVRGETLRLMHIDHVTAARALGAPWSRVIWHNILPGALGPALVATALGVADAVLLEAGLSFLSLGIQPPMPSWGGMILESREYLRAAPWLLLAPVLALVAATSCATLLGEALRRFLQPHTR